MVLEDYRLERSIQPTREDRAANEDSCLRLWRPPTGDDESGLRPEAGSLQRWLDLCA